MGQCFGLQGRRAVARRNKNFEYAPKRSWKHSDAHIMTQFKALSMESEGEEEEDRGGGGVPSQQQQRVTRTRAFSTDSEDDVYTSQPRRTGHLIFSEEEEEEEELDDDDDDVIEPHPPSQLNTLINKGFQLLPDTSPTLAYKGGGEGDTIELIKDTDDHVT